MFVVEAVYIWLLLQICIKKLQLSQGDKNSCVFLQKCVLTKPIMKLTDYCDSLFEYKRVKTHTVAVGNMGLGGVNPIRIQSMTTTDTTGTEASVAQCIRIIEAGGEIVRLTTPGREDALNLKNISDRIRALGFETPLVADVHFNPNAALIAAAIVEKVRINPGNFTGEAKKFAFDKYSESEQQLWLDEIRQRLVPLINICKQNDTTLRIGVNHGSLSDRIMARFGDTPEGMVESCMEYIQICRENDFHDIVISIKSSNVRVMVHTVRLLAATMQTHGFMYPLHLGVTEAGSNEEGRIKSAAGIGALLADGLGDTLRVSLTEAPEFEIPVGEKLADYVSARQGHVSIKPTDTACYSPYEYKRRKTINVLGVGGSQVPVVVTDATGRTDLFDVESEFVYTNDEITSSKPIICDYELWSKHRKSNTYPLLTIKDIDNYGGNGFLRMSYEELTPYIASKLSKRDNLVIIASAQTENPTAELRALSLALTNAGIDLPMIISMRYDSDDMETFQVQSAADCGLLFIDGLADGLMLIDYALSMTAINRTELNILQASRMRFSKAEFISCPGCGRTLYNLQDATQMIKQRTSHLKGLKIGVMGCIINGIGEMADADYGYVGAGYGKISLFRGKNLVKKAIPESEAVEALIEIIKADGFWTDPLSK